MSKRASISLGTALGAATTGWPAAVGGAWLSLGLLWLVSLAGPLLMMHLEDARGRHLAALVVFVVQIGLKLAAAGALYRTAIFGARAVAEGRGPGGLQFGAPEGRLFGASVVIVLFFSLVVIATGIVFAVAFNLSGLDEGYNNSVAALHAAFMRHHTAADWTFIAMVPVALIFFIFVGLKFALYAAATVAEKRMVTLNVLGLTSGNVGKLFIGLLALVIPFAIVWGVALHLTHGARLEAHRLPQSAAAFHTHLAVHAVMLATLVFGLLPLQTGFLASAYRQIIAFRAK